MPSPPRTSPLPPAMVMQYMTVSEAVKVLNVHRDTVYQMMEDGRLKKARERWGKRILIVRSSVERLLNVR